MNVIITSSRNATVEVYHTDETCPNARNINNMLEVSKEQAKRRGLELCAECKGENYQKGVSKDLSYYEAAKKAGKSD